MITRKVVLILGAGASAPFGFPSGADLKAKIVLHLDRSDPKIMFDHLTAAAFEPDHIESFRSALQKSGKGSVDAFLEHRTEFLEVGKAATACALLPCEVEQALFPVQPSWYDYLFNKLNAQFEEFAHNSVSVLTFNYDRSLEHYLFTALTNSYGKTSDECAEKLRSFPIVHLYGQLGQIPPLGSSDNSIEYGSPVSVGTLRRAANGIKIIHEAVSDLETFTRAHELLGNAERICFLGFGYDLTNIQRLMAYGPTDIPEVYGSAKGLQGRECQLIEENLKKLGFRGVHSLNRVRGEALAFLRENCPFD